MQQSSSSYLAQLVLLLCFCTLIEANARVQSGEVRGPNTGLIVSIDPKEPKGRLKVIQAKGLKPVNAGENMPVRRGNVLILDPATRAFVICSDGNSRELGPGAQPCPCKDACPSSICGGSSERMRPTRGGPDTDKGSFPVVLSPRATLLLNPRPTIRWTPIAGANESTTYKVTIYGENMKVIWSVDVNARTRLAYPDNKPPLTPGETYKVVVTSLNRSSEEDDSPDLGFVTLKKERAQELAREELKIKQQPFPEAQTRFLISALYANERLHAEAIEQLEELYNSAKEPVIARALADSYAAIGLNREAERRYLESLRLQDADDLEGTGLTQMSLAKTYEYLGMFEEAARRLEQAIEAYERLGDSVLVRELRERAQNLKRKS